MALQSRTAARKELLDQATSPDECERRYEESLCCLYTLQDDLQQESPFTEEDRNMITTCGFLLFHLNLDVHVAHATGFRCRDYEDQASPRSMSSPDGHELQGSNEGRTHRSESGRCEISISTVLGSTSF